MLAPLNESMKHAVDISRSLAKEYRNEFFYPAHLLKALVHKEVALAPFIEAIGKDTGYITEWAEVRMEEYPKSARVKENITGDGSVNQVFEEADNIRIRLGLDQITPICVFAAVIKPGIGFTIEQLRSFPVKEKDVLDNYLRQNDMEQAVTRPDNAPPTGTGALWKYCIDRTSAAREGKTDAIIGRDKETRMILEVLCRRAKPNVMITGEAGVGKTALVDGLSLDIIHNNVPEQLLFAQLFELDLGCLVAGASYKGEIEERLKQVLKEIKQLPKAILFIDEIHSLLDAKGSMGSGAANLLKPELARGELTVIGATTAEEYRKLIEPDAAFTRRFEVVNVLEPDEATAVKMLTHAAPAFERHHKLTIDKEAIIAAVYLSKRYVKDRRLPDAAIDLMDRTMAALRLMAETNTRELQKLIASLDALEAAELPEPQLLEEYGWLHKQLLDRLSPVLLGRSDDAPGGVLPDTPETYAVYLRSLLHQLLSFSNDKKTTVDKDDIAAVVAYKTGIPIGKIQAGEKEKLLGIKATLQKRVVGQDHAIKAIADAILESRSGLNKKGQPVGSFFFLGPTGTGKTELARSIANFLFNDEKAMIRFDMSEFKEEHSAALLYGAPPGYVGYEEGGMLVNKIRQTPYAVLLFDEIEKAHPSVFDTFLQILDEGHMHDRLGKQGDFSNALIIFTSNIASEWIADKFGNNGVPQSNELMELMASHFRPEFLARLTEIVPFAPISEHSLLRIFDIQLSSLSVSLTQQEISLLITDEAKKYLAFTGFTPRYGARQIAAVIRNQLRRPISRMLVAGEVIKGDTIQVDIIVDTLDWQVIKTV